MIKNIYYHIALQDKENSFSELSNVSEIDIRSIHEKGEIGKTGKYTNIPYDYNSVIFTDYSKDLNTFLELINTNIAITASIQLARHKELYLFMEFDTQCNFEISPTELQLINSLGVTLSISCEKEE